MSACAPSNHRLESGRKPISFRHRSSQRSIGALSQPPRSLETRQVGRKRIPQRLPWFGAIAPIERSDLTGQISERLGGKCDLHTYLVPTRFKLFSRSVRETDRPSSDRDSRPLTLTFPVAFEHVFVQ